MKNRDRILIVDDAEENLLLLSILLEDKGYEILKAVDGQEAIKAAKTSPAPDLILLDIMMPVMDGYQVCRQLKEDPALNKIPIIFMSGLDKADHKFQAFHEGGVDYITKPFEEKEILARVNTHLQLKHYQDKLELLVEEQTHKVILANNALKQKEEQHKLIMQTAMDGFWLVDEQGHLLEVNEAYCNMSGYSKQELLSMTIQDLEVIESPEETAKHIENIINSGKDRFESQHRSKDGIIFNVEVSVLRMHEKERLLVTFLRDITERKRAEERMKESEYIFKESQRAAFIGSYKTNFTTGYWESSEVLDKIFGITEDYNRSVQGWLELVHPDDKKMMSDYLKDEVISKRNQFDKEYRIIRKSDGEIRWVHGTGKVYFDSEGRITSMIGTIQDINDRKNIEAALQNSHRLESLGILAGGIAHEFNNLMAGIFGYIEIAFDYTVDEKSKLYISKAIDKIKDARELTGQMLTFAKGGAPLRKITPLSPLIEQSAATALINYQDQVSCSFNIDENLWQCNVDKSQITQVINNILINSVHSMNGSGTIEIRAENIYPEDKEHHFPNKGNYVKISIKDKGIGISKEFLSKIFDPFYTTKKGEQGLGLSICHSIIKRHCGTINVESEVGKGSTFHIYLPACNELEGGMEVIPANRTEAKR